MKILRHHLIALLACFAFFMTQQAGAIPAYARQYNLSCSTCHSPVPKLTPFGNEFAANGFQLKGLEVPNAAIQTDDSSLSLMRELPVAIRFDGFARIQPGQEQKFDMEWPFVMKLFSSGQIKSDISYFLYFLMNEGGNITGVEDAFIYFNDIGGQKLDVTVGQFQVADMIVPRELRPTFEDYQIYEIKPGLTKADLTYDRGIIVNYTLPSETDILLSVVNGNGIGPSTDGHYDADPYKNFVARVRQPVGSFLAIGTLGYLGKESSPENINTFSMIGGDATVTFDRFELLGQYIHRHDANPFFLAERDSAINSYGGFAQLMFAPQLNRSDWYLFLLYNKVRSDIEELKYHSIAGNFTYMISRNFKLTSEYGYDIERAKHSVTFGFMTAF